MKKHNYEGESFFCIGSNTRKPSAVIDMEKLYQQYRSKLTELFNSSYSDEDLYTVLSIIQIQYVYTVEERFFSGIYVDSLQELLQKTRIKLDRSIDLYIRWKLKSHSVDFNNEISLLVMFSDFSVELMNNLTEIELSEDLGDDKGFIMRKHWERFKKDYFDKLMSLYEKRSKQLAYEMRLKYLRLEKFVNDMIHPHELPKKSLIESLYEEVGDRDLVELWVRDKKIISDIVAQWRRSYVTCSDVDKLWLEIKSKIREIYIKVLAKRYHPDSNLRVLSDDELRVFPEMSNYLKQITNSLSGLFVNNCHPNDIEKNEGENESWWDKNIHDAIIEQRNLRQKLEQEEAFLGSQVQAAKVMLSEKEEIRNGVDALCVESHSTAETLSEVASKLDQAEEIFAANQNRLNQMLQQSVRPNESRWDDPSKLIESAVDGYVRSRLDPKV